MKLLGRYINGNCKVAIFDDGTKIRETDEDSFISSFPECIDLKITNQCDIGCPYCHENSKIDGRHGNILNAKFIDTLQPYTELALGGGNVLSHPDLIPFLYKLKEKNIVANMTVNQIHFIKQQDIIQSVVKLGLIKGLGVSLTHATNEFVELIKKYDNAVIHVINGVLKPSDVEVLANNNLKMLILGYKQFRRGNDWYNEDHENIIVKQMWLYENMANIINQFKVVSFDNLAIKQLEVKRLMSNKDWNEFYMGDDGQFTMYIDLVEEKFANNSTSVIRYNLMDNINDMFKAVKGI